VTQRRKLTISIHSLCRRAANLFKLAYFPWVHEKTSRSKAKLFAWSMDKKVFKRSLE
jgi:hypothetical protein